MKGLTSSTGDPSMASRPSHVQVEALHRGEAAGGDTESVGPHPRPLGEHAHLGPVRVPPGPAGPGLHVGRIDPVEHEDHDHVGERSEARHRVGPEPRIVEADHRLDAAPVVVDGIGPPTDDEPDGLQRDHDGQR